MLNLILALVMGGVMGWLASKVMARDASMGIFANVIVGCVGSILGRWLLGLVGMGSGLHLRDEPFNIMNLVTSFVGALVLLAIINLVQRGKVR
jgi:uncharacterized membrane protein YeaQ/YmgE (transglycosylase-associated protein family)